MYKHCIKTTLLKKTGNQPAAILNVANENNHDCIMFGVDSSLNRAVLINNRLGTHRMVRDRWLSGLKTLMKANCIFALSCLVVWTTVSIYDLSCCYIHELSNVVTTEEYWDRWLVVEKVCISMLDVLPLPTTHIMTLPTFYGVCINWARRCILNKYWIHVHKMLQLERVITLQFSKV